ncbi:MAG TPA: penicillin-binding protein 2 [Candidatus Avelusimicrobium excrementipullorum]|nr:penicillin-binding protein 2 [Candidatus Avelusimicrobium excrementipullorum]
MFKQNSPFAYNAKARMKLCGLLCLLAPLCIGVRLFYMQTFLHDELADKAERAIYNYLDEDRLRGNIYDANGHFLAESVRTHSCGISKRYVKDKAKTIDFLSKTLGISKKQIEREWNKHRNFFFVAKKIKPDVYMKILPVLRTPLGQGLDLTPEYERVHPYGDSAIDILGAANSKNLGLSGIEQMFNSEMSQQISKRRAKRARRGELIYDRSLKEERSVGSVYLTLDILAQYYAEQALEKAVKDYEPERGLILVQQPQTGRLLAAASYPRKDGQSLAFQFTYEPGSTFKTIAISSALDAGAVSINDAIDMSGRKWEIARGVVVRDRQHDKDELTIPEIMAVSSNIGAGKIALELGAKNLFYYMKAFGFGTKTDINFNGESKGYILPYNKWTVVDTATKGYGYGIALTPVQLIGAYSAVANGGWLMQPHLVDRIEYADGRTEQKAKTQKIRRVIKQETSDTMKKVLEHVVQEGSGKRARIKGYSVAGKTGTAEKLSQEGGYATRHHVVSFCGFTPIDDPQFTILVVLDNPSKYTFGGTAAAPVFKEVAEGLLSMQGVPPDRPEELQPKPKTPKI